MKNLMPDFGLRWRTTRTGLIAVLMLALLGCSSSDPPVESPADQASGGAPPIATPSSIPPENEDPGATETNFITPPCHADADCGGVRRCVDEADRRVEADAGADAGLALGRCVSPDGD
jgi:hypothetical protein